MTNDYEIRGGVTAIFVRYKDEIKECIISTSSLGRVKEFPNTWFARYDTSGKRFYVTGHKRVGGKDRGVIIHRWIKGIFLGRSEVEIDHIDMDSLNNTDENLRVATRGQNLQNRCIQENNTTGYRGVSFIPRLKKYQASFYFNKKQHYLGVFTDPEEAARVVAEKRKELMPYSKEGMGLI